MKRWLRKIISCCVRKVWDQCVFEREADDFESGRLVIGKHTYGHPIIEVYRGSEAKVIIGSYCSIGPRVRIITGGEHPADRVSTFPFRIKFDMPNAHKDGFPCTKGDVVIGNDVWLASDVTILSGVHIADGAVIMAGAVVTRDVKPYAIVGGVPARTVCMRLPESQIEALLEIKWWDWPEEKVCQEIPLLAGSQVDEFIERHRK